MTLAHGAGAWDWHFQPHLDVWVPMVLLLAGYFYALRRFGPAREALGEVPATPAQKTCFVLGVASLWIASDWPLHDLAEDYLFSVHMVQHLLFTFVAPPLLLLGLPAWMVRPLLGRGLRFKIVRTLTRPVVALLVFNAVIALTHWPAIVNLAVRSEPAHLVLHGVLLFTALAMWWPVVPPLPETRGLSDPARMLYLFLQSVVPTVPASFLTFARSPIYDEYAAAPHPWISAVDDQMIAGLIMKIGGGLLLWAIIVVLFFRWNAKEQRDDIETELTWEDFERDLEVWDLRK
jgi:putative membrane protein